MGELQDGGREANHLPVPSKRSNPRTPPSVPLRSYLPADQLITAVPGGKRLTPPLTGLDMDFEPQGEEAGCRFSVPLSSPHPAGHLQLGGRGSHKLMASASVLLRSPANHHGCSCSRQHTSLTSRSPWVLNPASPRLRSRCQLGL